MTDRPRRGRRRKESSVSGWWLALRLVSGVGLGAAALALIVADVGVWGHVAGVVVLIVAAGVQAIIPA